MGRRSEQKRAKVGVKAAPTMRDEPAVEQQADDELPPLTDGWPESTSAAAPWSPELEQWLRDRQAVLAAGGLLLLVVLLVFGQTLGHAFVNFDDPEYVSNNPAIKYGLSWQGIVRAFTQSHAHNWHPLTTLSHMLDCQIFGLWAGGHHLVNLLLHAATTVVLMLAFFRMTGRLWASTLLAAVFAIHPLRAESVAWISERKDVLSGFFFAATLWAYAAYVRYAPHRSGLTEGEEENLRPFSWARYLSVVVLFALGLLCKPMLVTVPFVLLLLDYWPLGRLGGERGKAESGERQNGDELQISDFRSQISNSSSLPSAPRSPLPAGYPLGGSLLSALLEKLPLLAMVVPVAVATAMIQRKAMQLDETVPLWDRAEHAALAYLSYLGQFVFPRGLAAFYPYEHDASLPWRAGAALIVLALITAAAVWWRKKCPQILVGWLWYLGMLVPVIGLVQVGSQSMADRYTYLPQIGIVMALVFSAAPLVGRRLYGARLGPIESGSGEEGAESQPRWRYALIGQGLGVAAVLATLLVLGWQQTSVWKEDELLWRHTLACTSSNPTALLNLGAAMKAKGRLEEAVNYYQQSLNLDPRSVAANNDLGVVLGMLGRAEDAAKYFAKALDADAECGDAYANIGQCLHIQNRLEEAARFYRRALEFQPDHEIAQQNLAICFMQTGRDGEARELLQRSHASQAGIAAMCCELATSLWSGGHYDAAIRLLLKCLEIDPDYAPARQGIQRFATEIHYKAEALLAKGKAAEALGLWRSAVSLGPQSATIYNDPAWVLATWPDAAIRSGKDAVQLAQRAVQISGRHAAALDTLAAAYAEAGQFQDALSTAQEALQQATSQKDQHLAESLGKRIELYSQGKPWRDKSTGPPQGR